MKKILVILSILFCVSLHAGDGYPEPEKREQQTIKNSNHNHNHNSTYIQVKDSDKNKKDEYGFYEFLKDWSATMVALSGFIAGYILIRRKIIESHITKALIDIQEANLILLEEITELMDVYTPMTYTLEPLSKDELKSVFEEIKKLYVKSQKANSGAESTLYYLKVTIQQTIKNYNRGGKYPYTPIFSRDLYGLIIVTFRRVTFLSTQVVQVPNSTRTETIQWFNKELQPYVTNAEFTKFRSFNFGLENDPDSALYTLFYSDVLDTSNQIFMRSVFQIYGSISTIFKFLWLNKIYAPVKISAIDEDSEVQNLYLIGFKEYEPLVNGGGTEYYYKLFYANPIDNYGFANYITQERFIEKYKDTYIRNSGFSMEKLKKLNNKSNFEIIELQFESEYLKELYLKNKKQIRKKLPKIDGLIRKFIKRIIRKIINTRWW